MNELAWATNMKKLERNNRVVLTNTDTGNWIKISKESFEMLNEAVINNQNAKQLIESFETNEDRIYIERLIEKLEELKVWKGKEKNKQQLEQVYFLLTHRCNLHCIHCSMDAAQCNSDDFLDTEKVIIALKEIIRLNPKQIVLSGGEPLFREDFFEILNYLSDHYRGEITVMTNGTLITEKNVDLLSKRITSIDISVDGINEQTCSKIRGKGVFSKVMQAIELLHSCSFTAISLSMVFGNSNYYMLPDFYEMNRKLGTKPIPRVFSPIGRGESSKDIFNQVSKEKLSELNPSNMQDTLKSCTCGACKKEICVDYKGDIYPCVLLTKEKYKLGNIFSESEVNMLTDNVRIKTLPAFQEFEKLYPDKIEYCKNCDINLFCWTCLHFADIYIDTDDFQERCRAKKEALEKLVWEME